jgi:hypothetical protein
MRAALGVRGTASASSDPPAGGARATSSGSTAAGAPALAQPVDGVWPVPCVLAWSVAFASGCFAGVDKQAPITNQIEQSECWGRRGAQFSTAGVFNMGQAAEPVWWWDALPDALV